jgi:hypothetical protein
VLLVPFAKKLKEKGQADKFTDRLTINVGILNELYRYGITKEQLSNLKALADYIGGKYHPSHGKMVVEISEEQLKANWVNWVSRCMQRAGIFFMCGKGTHKVIEDFTI